MIAVLAVGAGVGEALVTTVTLEGSVPCVKAHVLCEVMLVLESLVTYGAGIRPLIYNKRA